MTTALGDGSIGDRLRVVGARGRIGESLLGVALDVVEPYASDYLSADEYRRVCDLLRGPVEAATDTALGALADALTPGDPAIAARLETIRRRAL
jgi:hypothetical protein